MAKSSKRTPAPVTRRISAADKVAEVEAIDRAQAVIEFDMNGIILAVNDNFLALMGYRREEVLGRHQDLFVDAAPADVADYRQLWDKLGRGESCSGRFRAMAKGAREVWIRANFNPVLNRKGQPFMVVQYAADITANKAREVEIQGRLNAIDKSQASIEFGVDGTIITANANFLTTFGYTLEEIRGKHHSLLVDPAYRQSPEYRMFWDKLGRGEYDAGQYRRVGKGGREVWIQATYNPIMDMAGKPMMVVKYATDITEQRRKDEMNAAFKGALDNLTANIMVADVDLNIIYMNTTVREMMAAGQADFRKELPTFDVNRLMGANIDIFHKNPAHQRSMLTALTRTHVGQFLLGGRTLRVIANPMVNAAGKRIGTVVEWADRTVELGVEAEIRKLVESANAGDLTRRMDLDGKTGVFAEIGTGINQLAENMAQVVSRVQVVAGEVSRGAEEISEGNTNLSQRTEEQASSLEETASSMEEMTSTVKQNADNASRASQLATAARDQADKGGTVVSHAVRAMTEINDASRKIVDIVGVIDEIAFQTNLLALNAAGEAARAGEQGRGFAVVASEVRSLAGRSATAAKEIKGLIQDSVKKVEEGSSLVTQSGQTLDQIVIAVKKVSDIIGEIAGASHEQSAGIDQVNKAVMQLDEMTQQNAALVEEASAASQSMAGQARSLIDLMGRYQVPAEATAAAVAAASQADAPRGAAAPKAERRSPVRPWSSGERKATALSRARSGGAAAAGGGDAEWKEF
jgi:methyl-accepting chemotaxis protein